VCFCVSLDHFGFVLLVLLGFVFSNFVLLGLAFSVQAKRLAGKNVSEVTYFVSSGTQNLAPSIQLGPETFLFSFLPHDAMRGTSHGPGSVCVCLCLSVTSRSSTKTAKRRITQTTPHDSPGSLDF